MKRAKIAQKIHTDTKRFLEQNPEITKALRLFDISYEQYRSATEQVSVNTENTTNPKSILRQRI